jgi:hypothetical protein
MFYVRVANSEVAGNRPITIISEENGLSLSHTTNLDAVRTGSNGDEPVYEQFSERRNGRF